MLSQLGFQLCGAFGASERIAMIIAPKVEARAMGDSGAARLRSAEGIPGRAGSDPGDARTQRVLQWLAPVAVALDVDASRAEDLVRAAARLVADETELDAERTWRALWRREQAASTALGLGVAVPHARIDDIEKPTLFYVRTRHAIEFGAPDKKPVVHFVVIIVPPAGDVDDHLELLARVSQVLSEQRSREQLALANNVSDVRRAFAEALAGDQ
jgi:PTS system nitrogen regulatory IIA component